jgi:hypothetical protein|tara:strand:+ start:9 stop:479 length:471 start_codon:yes stop_codon:yes gene_type:complete
MKKISEHISYKEATYSQTAKQLGLDNKPKKEHLESMELVSEKVFEPLREWVGGPIKVNSFYRSEELNCRIGGASKTSAHMLGQAIDITTMGKKTNLEMFEYIIKNLDFDQVISEYPVNGEPRWIHLSYRNKKDNRKQALEIKRRGRYYNYTGCKTC